MAKKKTTKIRKVMTVPMPKPEAPTEVEGIVLALNSLTASVGWGIIVKILDENIKYLEIAILEKIDPVTKQALTDTEIEVLRTKRGLNIELRDTPQNYIKRVQDTGEVPENYDPYYQTASEIKKAQEAGQDR